jgi:hypothetical protein
METSLNPKSQNPNPKPEGPHPKSTRPEVCAAGWDLGFGHWDWGLLYFEWARLDSNQGPTDYEPAALTAELRARLRRRDHNATASARQARALRATRRILRTTFQKRLEFT